MTDTEQVPDGDAIAFAERVISLIDSGRKSATYKLAALLAIVDIVAESTDALTGPPVMISARDVARRVIELYWPQTAVYSGAKVLKQSPQNDIPMKLAAWRKTNDFAENTPLADAIAHDPTGWAKLEPDLVATVIGMPLAKLQRFGDGRTAIEDRFIYDFEWRDEVKAPTVAKAGFPDHMVLQPSVGMWLVRLMPLFRPLIEAKWVGMVTRHNADVVDNHQLGEFMFGAARISLERVRQPLVALQGGACFYCAEKMTTADVDHFVPWSRRPDNLLDNLVAAHPVCNNAKSASIAAVTHLESWVARTDADLEGVSAEAMWPRRPDRTLGAVRATYLWLPPGARLWRIQATYEKADHNRLSALLSA